MGIKFEWTKKCKCNFEELKKKSINEPVLTIHRELEGFIIYSDASKLGVECVLM